MSQKRNKSQAKKLRNQAMIAMKIEGKTDGEIAEAVGISREQVSRVLNSDDVKALVKKGENRFASLVGDAVTVVEQAMAGAHSDMGNALKAAVTVLKSTGIAKDRVDLSHSFPKPTVVLKSDGSMLIMGAENEDDENGDV